MDQLIEAFGIDVKLIISQIINFGILAAALTYFLYKPLLNILQTREDTITQGLKDAEAAAQAKAEADKRKKEVLSKAEKEAQEVTNRAKIYAEEKAVVITQGAQEKAEQIIQTARKKKEELKEQALKESESEIAKLAILAAQKVLSEKS